MHRIYQQKKQYKCRETLTAYPVYLLQEPEDSETQYYYAELLWQADRYADAAVEYRRVATDPKCRFAKNAAYVAVLARQKLAPPAPDRRFDGNPWPLNIETQAVIDAIEFY